MRFMMLYKPGKETNAPPSQQEIAAMGQLIGDMAKAGGLIATDGLQHSSKGARVRIDGGKFTVTDGPFTEAKELVAGYTLIQVKSREEALEWARRFPNPALADGEIEVRQLFELDDFGESKAVDRFRKMNIA